MSDLNKNIIAFIWRHSFWLFLHPGRQWKILKEVARAWKKINEKKLRKEIMEKYSEAMESGEFFEAKGCKRCNGTGYSGRLGTLETLLVDDEIKAMINTGHLKKLLKNNLREKKLMTLRDNAMIKFIKGWTTLKRF